jgi:prepilin-type processing-associated H-X9-DG protein
MNGWVGETYTLSLIKYHRWLRAQDVSNPSQIILFVDEDIQSIDDGCWLPTGLTAAQVNLHNELSIRHDVNLDTADASGNPVYDQTGRGNVAFCDGHADFVSRQFSFELVGGPNNPYRDHYQPTNKPLPPDVPY